MANVTTRRVVAAVVALIGGYLLYVSADPASGFGTTLLAFWAGVALFVAVGAVLIRYYQPGVDAPSADEVDVREWRFVRFLRYGREAAPLYLGLRLFLAYEWIQAGLHKLGDPGWMQTGQALQGYWQRAVTVPATGSAPIVYPAYRAFLQFMLDNGWYTWYSKVIVGGELLIGLGFLFGGLIGFAAFFALLMNFAFLFAGSTSSNPTLIILEVVVLLGWRAAGWWGVDRILLPRIGTPWGGLQTAPPSGALPQGARGGGGA
ncbi:MAG TPA: DoxX family protein [Chloroflexota bacterium]|nr:DoxX family protein [Chloroflexota bacterium]